MVRIGDWLTEAWKVFTESIGVHIVLALIVGLGSLLTIGILAGPLACGWYYIILRQLREPDYKPEIGDVGKGFEVFLQSFLAWLILLGVSLVAGIIGAVLGSILPVIGQLIPLAIGWAVGALFLFVLPLIIERRLAVGEAISQSVDKVKPEFWGFFGFAALVSVISGIGGAFCGVGWLIAGPFTIIATALAYRDNFGFAGVQAANAAFADPTPPTAPAPPAEPPEPQ